MFTFVATTREILEQAIRNELVSRVYLNQLAGRVEPEPAREAVRRLAERKIMHLSHFERRFHDLFGLTPPPRPLPEISAASSTPIDLHRALTLAHERERDLESNWRFLAEQVAPGESRSLLLELAETQWRFREEVRVLLRDRGDGDMDFLDF